MFRIRNGFVNQISQVFSPSVGRNYRHLSGAAPSISLPPVLLERARSLYNEHAQLAKKLGTQFDVTIAKRTGELNTAARAFEAWEFTSRSLSELRQLLEDPLTDPELRSLANEELQSTTETLDKLSRELQISLVPTHPFAALPCLIELRPGAGGSEAALFAGDLMRMYQAYCKRHNLRCTILKIEETLLIGSGSEKGVQEVVLEVEAEGSYSLLRCEAGVHRVQRIPATDSSGRTHTSAVSVIVLPSFPSDGREELGENSFNDPSSDFFVNPKDVETDTFRARGAGGQHVNTTDSAVRLTHVPTNTVVAVQDSRSQPKNRQKAWLLLRAKIAQARREAREDEMALLRRSVVGVARMGFGDKIRTYNWGQQRVTDHRSGITLYGLDDILAGSESLDQIMESVKNWLKERDVEALLADEISSSKKETK